MGACDTLRSTDTKRKNPFFGAAEANSQQPSLASASPKLGIDASGKSTHKSDGSPFRHPLAWQDPDFYDPKSLDKVSSIDDNVYILNCCKGNAKGF